MNIGEQLTRGRVSILAVSPLIGDHVTLRSLLCCSNWQLHHACTCEEALGLLAAHVISVVVSEKELPDGDWRDLSEHFTRLKHPPELVVSSRQANEELAHEVLNHGGYDVLRTPFRFDELVRIGFLAHYSWLWKGASRAASYKQGPPHGIQKAPAGGRLTDYSPASPRRLH